MSSYKMPVYFVSHGGGPWPWLKKEMPFFDKLEKSFKQIPLELAEKPKAILMISGHWEESDFGIMSSAHPPMLYDYGGFPEHTYHIKYDAPGSPELAVRVQELIKKAGLSSHLDDKRGYDHGTFVTAFAMYPDANIPVIQISINKNYDPQTHLALGRALAPLRNEGVLIMGSGLSYHNLSAMRKRDAAVKIASSEFDKWLQDTLIDSAFGERTKKLLKWSEAPSARQAHPEEDHLIPLMVVVGAAEEESAKLIYHEEDFMGGVTASSFQFGKN